MAGVQLMRGAVQTFCEEHSSRPWAWGSVDCLMAQADWVKAVCGQDPLAEFRGAYATETGAVEILRILGGMIALIQPRVITFGWQVAMTAPIAGDIAILGSAEFGRPQFGAIHDGADWRVRTEEGYPAVKARARRAWRYPSCRHS